MEYELLEEKTLLRRLTASRRRFQKHMQQLMEKYNQPFEDDPLVHMSTLTYQTPEGLKIWGGRLIKERNKGQVQDPRGKPVDRTEGPGQASACGSERPLHHAQVPGADSESSDVDAALDQEGPLAGASMPAVPRSPLKNELRRKYLTQVDILLQDTGHFEDADQGGGKDASVALVPSLASPATPSPGYSGSVFAKSPEPASSPTEWDPSHFHPADMAIAPRNDSLSLLGTSSNSCLHGQSFEGNDICNVTISDLYAGMLHSMSRLLSTKPSCIISTKTFIVQNWNSRRRHARRSRMRMNETYCQGARRSWRSSKERPEPHSEPGKAAGVLRDCKNLLHVACHKASLKSEKASLEGNKPQIHKLDPRWKELQVTPRKHPLLTYLDFNAVHSLDREDRLRALRWLISPVKIVSRPRMLPGQAASRYREIEIKFNKLHQECCPDPRKQPGAAGFSSSWTVDVYRGGSVSPNGPRGSQTHRLSFPFSKAKSRRLSEDFENLGKRSIEAGRCLPKSDSSSCLSKASPSQSLGRSWQTYDLFQGHNSGTFRKALSPSNAISALRIEPLRCGRNRYDEIKEKFNQLHQKYCQITPPRVKVSAHIGASPGGASTEALCRPGSSGRSRPDSGRQGSQHLSPSRQLCIQNPRGSAAVEARPTACTACVTRRDPQFPAKRRRLSDPQVCGHCVQNSSGGVDKAVPRPEDQVSRSQPAWFLVMPAQGQPGKSRQRRPVLPRAPPPQPAELLA